MARSTVRIKETVIVFNDVPYEPCIKCGSSHVAFDDISAFGAACYQAQCNGCRVISDVHPTIRDCIEAWNKENSLADLLGSLQKERTALNTKIEEVMARLSARNA